VCSWCAPEPLDRFRVARTGGTERDGAWQTAYQGLIQSRHPTRSTNLNRTKTPQEVTTGG